MLEKLTITNGLVGLVTNNVAMQVQIRPWNLADSDFVMDGTQPLDPRKTIFVGGVPRPLRAGMQLHSVDSKPLVVLCCRVASFLVNYNAVKLSSA